MRSITESLGSGDRWLYRADIGGYRTTTQPGHHARTIETLEYTIRSDDKTIRKVMAFSRKRNIASYDSAVSISDEELKQILVTAENLREAVEAWLSTTHPELVK